MDTQTCYQKALLFAAEKHQQQQQFVPGTKLPYTVHISNVAMEILVAAPNSPDFMTEFAVQLALLHDTLEDTETTFEELAINFGEFVAKGVQALTKNTALAKAMQMQDSLERICQCPKEVAAVKLADRITNLQPPPHYWTNEKKLSYQKEALLIFDSLKDANTYLAKRLAEKITEYSTYIQ